MSHKEQFLSPLERVPKTNCNPPQTDFAFILIKLYTINRAQHVHQKLNTLFTHDVNSRRVSVGTFRCNRRHKEEITVIAHNISEILIFYLCTKYLFSGSQLLTNRF